MGVRLKQIVLISFLVAVPIAAAAQVQMPVKSPACDTEEVYCVTINLYDGVPVFGSYNSDNIITLDEVAGNLSTYIPENRLDWLMLNGYDQNLPGNSVFPNMPVTVAIGSTRVPEAPQITPVCQIEPNDCLSSVVPESNGEGVAMFHFLGASELGYHLSINGLEGSGITRYSLLRMAPGEIIRFAY